MKKYNIAIVGAGPAGLSAAGRACALDRRNGLPDPSYVLIEGFGKLAKTIQQYQKGKSVMAEPGYLTLRSDFDFRQGKREEILQTWEDKANLNSVNIQYGCEVTRIEGEAGNFTLSLSDGTSISAENIVLSIGLQGNPRRLGVPGSEHPRVQYQLDDPEEYQDEHILVVGAGDAAIENAIALTALNKVTILNRKSEFSRAKEGNLNAVLKAINSDVVPLDCYYESQIKEVRLTNSEDELAVVLDTPNGDEELLVNRIIARLGAIPPRKFIESMGIEFPNDQIESLPELDEHYQSNVKGIYLIGALAGYPLIKQAMNQGYDVVEFIDGNYIEPADQVLLEVRFSSLPFPLSVNEQAERFQRVIPLFAQLNSLQFRELLIESEMTVTVSDESDKKRLQKEQDVKIKQLVSELPKETQDKIKLMATKIIRPGDEIFTAGSYNTSVYIVISGSVTLNRQFENGKIEVTEVLRGDFFGETSLLSGHPANETATASDDCVLVEIPRRLMLKLMSSNEVVKDGIEWKFIYRELLKHFATEGSESEGRLRQLAEELEIIRCKAGEVLFTEGEDEPWMYLVKAGGFRLSQNIDGNKVFLWEERAGKMIGQLAVMGDSVRRTTAVANVLSEAIKINRNQFAELVDTQGMSGLKRKIADQQFAYARSLVRPENSGAMDFLLENGLGEATNTLVIDESLCVGCDNCEKACAETHDGISRLNRKHGPTFGTLHIATACRHCEQPHCMKDCPPNAIRRDPSGAVYITDDCIGCENCQNNCPYGDDLHQIIRMATVPKRRRSLLSWMLFDIGSGPGEKPDGVGKKDDGGLKKAYKCDACVDQPGRPACVMSCPTGAAQRVGPLDYVQLIDRQGR